MEKIKNAIIIYGPGRSGTTLLNNLLSLQKDLYWISSYVNKIPNFPILSILNKLLQNNYYEQLSRGKRKLPRPTEAYGFWKHYISDFNQANGEINTGEIESVIRAINKIQRYTKGTRFVFKLTGVSRYQIIENIFENPYIIWIDRNPKHVILSKIYHKWGFWENLEEFDKIPMSEHIRLQFQKYEYLVKEKELLKRFNFLQVFYEDLVRDRHPFFMDLCSFLDLEYHPQIRKLVDSWEIKTNTERKYATILSIPEDDYLTQLVQPFIEQLGYG